MPTPEVGAASTRVDACEEPKFPRVEESLLRQPVLFHGVRQYQEKISMLAFSVSWSALQRTIRGTAEFELAGDESDSPHTKRSVGSLVIYVRSQHRALPNQHSEPHHQTPHTHPRAQPLAYAQHPHRQASEHTAPQRTTPEIVPLPLSHPPPLLPHRSQHTDPRKLPQHPRNPTRAAKHRRESR